jgi:Putative transposase
VDATVRIEGHDRAGLERLLRYCDRPPFALERLAALDEQRLIYRFPKPRPDGRTSVTLAPLELIQRLAWQNAAGSLQAIPGAASSLC